MCAQVSRAGWYRRSQEPAAGRDQELRDRIQQLALEWPSYGSRRMTAQLRRGGWGVNRKRV
jgi:hypothetical protein